MISMLQSFKSLLWIGLLAAGLQVSWAFSLNGPVGNGGDSWQLQANGFNPLVTPNPLGFGFPHQIGPKNIGEEYRPNAPVMYYTFDDNFNGYFGSSGTNAVIGAFNILNSVLNGYTNNVLTFNNPTNLLTGLLNGSPIVLNPTNNVDSYSAGLTLSRCSSV